MKILKQMIPEYKPLNINSPFIGLTFLHDTILKFKKFDDMQENDLDNLYPYLSETNLFSCKP